MSRVRPDLPQAFDGVVATAMAKAAEDRFASCGELAHAARNAASGTARRVDGSPPGHVGDDRLDSGSAAVPAPEPEPERRSGRRTARARSAASRAEPARG